MAEKEKKPKIDLDKLINDLDPKKILEKAELPHLRAHHKYKIEKITVDSYEDFRKQITNYVKYHHKSVFRSEMPDEIAFSHAQSILDGVLEKEGGFEGAYEKARNGRLPEILKVLMEHELQDHKNKYTNSIFRRIDPHDFDTHVDLVKQYKSKYGKFLSKDIKQKSNEELAKNYISLINHHQNVVESVKGKMQKYEPKSKVSKMIEKLDKQEEKYYGKTG